MRLTRFMCLALVMCIGLTAFAQDPEVIKSGNQATAVVNNTEFDFTLTLRFDGNKQSQKVNLPKGQRCEIKEDCYQINYNGKSGNHLWYLPLGAVKAWPELKVQSPLSSHSADRR